MFYENILFIFILNITVCMFLFRYNLFLLLLLTEILWVLIFCRCTVIGLFFDYPIFFFSGFLCFLFAAAELSMVLFLLYRVKKVF